VVVITNQSCVGKNLLTQSELDEIHDEMKLRLFQEDDCAVIDQIYVCTSVDERDPRKIPNPGMITEACKDWGITATETLFIGDTLTDMQAAKLGGVTKRILVETGYGRGLMGNQSACSSPELIEKTAIEVRLPGMSKVAPFVYAPNLAAAANWLVKGPDQD
jgi:HAD superfamily hydrolase (TIGR01662 family)